MLSGEIAHKNNHYYYVTFLHGIDDMFVFTHMCVLQTAVETKFDINWHIFRSAYFKNSKY